VAIIAIKTIFKTSGILRNFTTTPLKIAGPFRLSYRRKTPLYNEKADNGNQGNGNNISDIQFNHAIHFSISFKQTQFLAGVLVSLPGNPLTDSSKRAAFPVESTGTIYPAKSPERRYSPYNRRFSYDLRDLST
jgi:hypothetical protein